MNTLKEINEIIVLEEVALNLLKESDDEMVAPRAENDDASYTITMSNYDAFMQTLEKINKKALKYGVKPLTVKNKEKVTIKPVNYKNNSPFDKPAIMGWKIQLEGEPVRINGWKFLASVDHTSGNGNNVITFIPGSFNPEVKRYATASHKNCDFCHSNRDRNNTYIIQNDAGEMKQIGGQCLKKYVGDEARQLAKFSFSMSDAFDDLDNDEDGESSGGGGSGYRQTVVDAETALSAAIIITDKYGFVRSSESEMGKITTRELLAATIFGFDPKTLPTDYHDTVRNAAHPTDDVKKRANEIITWAKSLSDDEKSTSYMLSLESIIDADMVGRKTIGIIASVPFTYDKAMGKIQNNAKKDTGPPSEYVGSVGAKIPTTPVTATYAKYHDGTYGAYQMVKFKDDAGNDYTWFNTSKAEIENGNKYNIVGTVKKHEEYNGKKQTILTRVKVM